MSLPDLDRMAGTTTAANERSIARILYYLGMLTIGGLSLRPILSLTVSDLLFLGAVVAQGVGILLANKRLVRPPSGVLLFGILLFTFGGLLSSVGSAHAASSLGVLLRFVYITFVWFWLSAMILTTPEHRHRALVFWLASAATCGAAAVIESRVGLEALTILPSYQLPPGAVPHFGFYGRYVGLTDHPNNLGGLTSIALPTALVLFASFRGPRLVRAAYAVFLVLISAGMMLSGSLGSWLAGATGVGTAMLLSSSKKSMLAAGALLAVASVGAITYSAAGGGVTPIDRVGQTFAITTSVGSVQTRLDMNQQAFQAIAISPIVGVGLDSESGQAAISSEIWAVHNMFLLVWVGGGLLCFVGLIIILAAIARHAVTVISAKRKQGSANAIGLFGSFVAFIVFGLSEPTLFVRFGWVPAALLLASAAAARRQPNLPAPVAPTWRARTKLSVSSGGPSRPARLGSGTSQVMPPTS